MSDKDLLQSGDIFELKTGHTVYSEIPAHFVYSNRQGCFDLSKADIKVGEFKNGLDTVYLKGKYVVLKTAKQGGSTGHDPYPDGHCVYAQKMDSKEKIEVHFYQTGCFTAMNLDIKPLNRGEVSESSIKNLYGLDRDYSWQHPQ